MRIESRLVVGPAFPVRRFVVFVLTVLLLAGTLDAGLVHACPHHDALPGQRASGEAHGDGDGLDTSGHPTDAHTTACTCVGDCVAGGGMPIAHTAIVRTIDAPVVEATAHPGDIGRAAPIWRPPYLLPYPNAPPPQG